MISNYLVPTALDFTKVQFGQSMLIPLVSNINLSNAREVNLLARCHSASFTGTGTNPTLAFSLLPSAPADDGRVYLGSTSVVTASYGTAVIPVTNMLATGSNFTGNPLAIQPVFGMAILYASYTQYGTGCTVASGVFSVDVVVKS